MIEEEQVQEIPTPTPYSGKDRNTALVEDIEEQPEEIEALDPLEQDTPEPEGLIQSTKQEHDWQKRYSDLKSYHDRKQNEWMQQEELLSAKLKIADEKRIRTELPKSKEELEDFQKEYPDVYDVVQTVSTLQANEKLEEIKEELALLKKQEEQAKIRTAEQELLSIHSDFLELKDNATFLEWLQNQPSNISDGIYKNRTDAKWAARVIDLYKLENNQPKKGRPKKTERDLAAETVSKPTASAPTEASEGKKIWSIQEIARLKPHQFMKLESEIDAARREGRIR
jgi:hypothetical protein